MSPATTPPPGFDEWIRTTLDLLEGATKHAEQPWPWTLDDEHDGVVWYGGLVIAENVAYGNAKHISTWNPDFALRIIHAARTTLAHHRAIPSSSHPGYDCQWCLFHYPCFDARNAAAPFRGWPGWRGDWAL